MYSNSEVQLATVDLYFPHPYSFGSGFVTAKTGQRTEIHLWHEEGGFRPGVNTGCTFVIAKVEKLKS